MQTKFIDFFEKWKYHAPPVLNIIHSPKLKYNLAMAKEDGRQYLPAKAIEIENA